MRKQAFSAILLATSLGAYAQQNATVNENPILIGNQRSLSVSREQLVGDPVLRMPDGDNDYRITGYQVSYVPKGKGNELQGPFVIKGDNLSTGNAANILSKAQPGDRIFFEEIIAVSSKAGAQPLKLSAAVKIR